MDHTSRESSNSEIDLVAEQSREYDPWKMKKINDHSFL
jgi:hypothetical protein